MIRYFLLLILTFLLVLSCSESTINNEAIDHTADIPAETIDTSLQIPDLVVDKTSLQYDNKTSLWTHNEELYSGYAVSFYQDDILKEKIGFLNGRKQNQATLWHPDGHPRQIAHYHKGKLHGEKKTWSADTSHVLLAQLNYFLGKAHGAQTKWYATGEVYKKLHLNMGKEEGMQQAFRKNGVLYANYEAKDGRSYGLKKASLCFDIDDEEIQDEQ